MKKKPKRKKPAPGGLILRIYKAVFPIWSPSKNRAKSLQNRSKKPQNMPLITVLITEKNRKGAGKARAGLA